jgi:predicted ATP-binding protein involved in virulence
MGTGDQLTDPMLLPLVAFYGTGRLWNENDVNERKRRREPLPVGRSLGYVDCLSSQASFKGLLEWFERIMAELGDAKFSREQSGNLGLVEAVREATRIVLGPTGWQELIWNYEHKRSDVKHAEYGVLPLSSLSDGVRNMVALVADIARRCASLNPHLREQAARRTPGVLLIDEVDMHLHPRWQQLIVASLQDAFPSLQMIVSTHSPHVLSTVDAESIRVVRLSQDQGLVEMPGLQTQGVESGGVLSEVMEVKSSPPVAQAEWLSDYRALVQTSNEESSVAKDLWDKLLQHFGEEHPVIAEMQVLRRLQEFRRKNQVPPQQGQ